MFFTMVSKDDTPNMTLRSVTIDFQLSVKGWRVTATIISATLVFMTIVTLNYDTS